MPIFPASMLPLLFLAPPADAWLGIYLDPESDAAVVLECIPESPAAKAGLQAGDVLLAVGDKATANRDEFAAAIRGHKPGDRVSIRIRRGDKEQRVIVKLGERPAAMAEAAPAKQAEPRGRNGTPSAPAVEARPEVGSSAPTRAGVAQAHERGYLGLRVRETDGGVVIEGCLDASPAQAAGVAAGESITAVGDQRIGSLADLDRCLQQTSPGQKVALTLRGAQGVRSVLVELGAAAAMPTAAEIEPVPLRETPEPRRAPAAGDQAVPPAPSNFDLERELKSLRAELADLRRQLEALRRDGRE